MTPSTSVKFEGHGKELCNSGWFLGSFFVPCRVDCACVDDDDCCDLGSMWPCLCGAWPTLDDAMLCGCSWGRFSTCVTVVQVLPCVSSCVCESDDSLHVCFPGISEAFDTEKGLVGLFCISRVCGHAGSYHAESWQQ